jgi:phosphate/phosphite/phosphonate ABC transporter binding protein
MRFKVKGTRAAFGAVLAQILSGLTFAAALSLAPAASAQQLFRVTAIPDESPTELQRKFKPLGAYLEKELGMKVEFIPVTDYAAAVEALVNRKVEMAWFGGFTFVQARIRSNDAVIPLVQRVEDEKFRSVFVTADPTIKRLEDLKGKTLSFGSPSSTSGHLMPRSFLLQAGVDPDRDLRVSFSGAHDATARSLPARSTSRCGKNCSLTTASTPRGHGYSSPPLPITTTTGRCTATSIRRCARNCSTPSWRSPSTPRRGAKSSGCSAPRVSCRPAPRTTRRSRPQPAAPAC